MNLLKLSLQFTYCILNLWAHDPRLSIELKKCNFTLDYVICNFYSSAYAETTTIGQHGRKCSKEVKKKERKEEKKKTECIKCHVINFMNSFTFYFFFLCPKEHCVDLVVSFEHFMLFILILLFFFCCMER